MDKNPYIQQIIRDAEYANALIHELKQSNQKHLKTIDDLEHTLANLLEENKSLQVGIQSAKLVQEKLHSVIAEKDATWDGDNSIVDAIANEVELKPATPHKPTIAIIIGHDEIVQGAYSKHLEKHEWEFYTDQVLSRPLFPKNVNWHHFYRDRTGIKSAHDQIKKKIENGVKFDAILEFHFNAFDGYAYGAEILTNNAKKLANNLLTHWCTKTTIRNRGVNQRLISERGGYNISALERDGISTPYLLLEPFFGTDKKDCDKIKDINIIEFFVNKTAELLNEQYTKIA